jgi:anaerobic glycerol-3-phosphate dehydrogenase
MRLCVVGAGVAGTAAAWAARRLGADVAVSFDRAGASALYSGALDLLPWQEGSPVAPLESELLAFATSLEAWSLAPTGARVATYEGVLRPARGVDSALLDVARYEGRNIGVADSHVFGWDASSLARSLGASPWALETRTRFTAIPVPGIFDAPEARAPSYDLAQLHDAPERLARLANCLSNARDKPDAWLVGPWLGTGLGVADRLRALLGKQCGETTSPPGGPAGARFEASRSALFDGLGVHVRQERITSVVRRGARLLPMGPPVRGRTANEIGFDAVILSTGGLVGGGIVLDDTGPSAAFRSSVEAELRVGSRGRLLDHVSSADGFDLASLGRGALERVGILPIVQAGDAKARLFVAGDCVADLRRTALTAARSGIAAARAALGP